MMGLVLLYAAFILIGLGCVFLAWLINYKQKADEYEEDILFDDDRTQLFKAVRPPVPTKR